MSAPAPERARLEGIAADSWYSRGLNTATVEYCAEVFARFWRGPRCLEMGPAEGVMTRSLARAFPELTLVEGAEAFCGGLRERFPGAHVVQALFEEFEPAGRFDTIVLGHVLEHVEDPVQVPPRPDRGQPQTESLCCAVPNARSLHRQAAVILGMLDAEDALNPTDLHHGHRRVYSERFRADFLAAGLSIRFWGGYWIKPPVECSNGKLDSGDHPRVHAIGRALSEHRTAEIYVIASREISSLRSLPPHERLPHPQHQ